MKKQKTKETLLYFCDRKVGWFKKCKGEVVRVKAPFTNPRFIKDFKIRHVDYCKKCDAVHMLWKEGELKVK